MTALVLLPGMDGTGALFARFVAALGSDIEPVVVSYPGETQLGYEELTGYVRERLPQDRPFVILGESFSGPIAVSIAAAPPPGLRGIVLCCSFVTSPLPGAGLLRRIAGAVPVAGLPRSWMVRALVGRRAGADVRREVEDAVARVAPEVLRARMRAVLEVDVTAQLRRVGVPVLCLRASEDRVVPTAAAGRIAEVRPDARVVEIAGPHLLLQAEPEAAAAQVTAYVREVSPRTR